MQEYIKFNTFIVFCLLRKLAHLLIILNANSCRIFLSFLGLSTTDGLTDWLTNMIMYRATIPKPYSTHLRVMVSDTSRSLHLPSLTHRGTEKRRYLQNIYKIFKTYLKNIQTGNKNLILCSTTFNLFKLNVIE